MTFAAIGAIGKGIQLIAPTIETFVQATALVQSTFALFQKGDITKDDLLTRWKAAGVNVQLADANLQAAMDEALRNQPKT